MTEPDFDIWLHGFATHTREPPHAALSRVFGIPAPAAEALLATLPRVVRRDATAAQAERIVQALEAIGGQAEAVPTRVVPAPVLLVGTQVAARHETIVQHAPRSGELREHGDAAGSPTSRTLQLGTQELEAFFAAPVIAAAAPPPTIAAADLHDTLVQPPPPWAEPEPDPAPVDPPVPLATVEPWPPSQPPREAPATPKWSDLSLAPPTRVSVRAPGYPEAPRGSSATAVMGAPRLLEAWDLGGAQSEPPAQLDASTQIDPLAEKPKAASLKITHNVHEWMKSTEDLPAISLAPPSSRPPPNIGPQPPSQSPNAWRDPLALPPSGAPPATFMRPASQRGRSARARSQRPPSMRPVLETPAGPSLSEALVMLLNGDRKAAIRSYPSLAFLVVLFAVTFTFVVAYAVF